jgi:hypothetical protein
MGGLKGVYQKLAFSYLGSSLLEDEEPHLAISLPQKGKLLPYDVVIENKLYKSIYSYIIFSFI